VRPVHPLPGRCEFVGKRINDRQSWTLKHRAGLIFPSWGYTPTVPDASFVNPAWEPDRAELPGRHVARLGVAAGASELGASLFALEPGATGSPLHAHHANEEMMLVLEGTPSLRGPRGTRVLKPGDVVAFPRGDVGTHSVSNASDDEVRYLMVSTANLPDVVVYPETGATLVVLDRDALAFPNDTAIPRSQVVEEAFRAAGGSPRTS
jgi:uncharacterized cupin superfamily protein